MPTGRTAFMGAILAAAVVVFGGIVSWVGLGSLPLDVRLVVAAVTVLFALIAVALVFNDLVKTRTGKRRRKHAMVTALVISVFAVYLLRLAVIYHSVIVEDTCHTAQGEWQCVGLSAARHPVTLNWRFSIDGPPPKQADWAPGFWTESTGSPTTEFDDTSLTIHLVDFAYPQRYGVSFKLTPTTAQIHEQLQDLVPNTTTVLRDVQVRRLVITFIVVGVVLWLVASWLLYSSARWLERLSPPTY